MTLYPPGEGLAKVVATAPIKWTILSRMAVAMALLLPTEMRLTEICASCLVDDAAGVDILSNSMCQALSFLEVACAFAYVAGGLTRLFALPAIATLSLKALSGLLSLWPDLSIPGIVARGDWVFSAALLCALTLVMDLTELGSGLWSVDYLLSVRYPTKNDRPTFKESP